MHPPLAFTAFQLTLPWWLETSIPKGEAAETKVGKASARTASNFISLLLLHCAYLSVSYRLCIHSHISSELKTPHNIHRAELCRPNHSVENSWVILPFDVRRKYLRIMISAHFQRWPDCDFLLYENWSSTSGEYLCIMYEWVHYDTHGKKINSWDIIIKTLFFLANYFWFSSKQSTQVFSSRTHARIEASVNIVWRSPIW